MRWDTGGTAAGQARNARPRRQLRRLALVAAFLLSACGGSETERRKSAPIPPGLAANRAPLSALLRGGVSFAAVAADESRAAEVGRDVLLGGGNATDAAVAMYFAMAVTLPSAASLGASGACIVHDSKTRAGEAFVFAPVAAPGGDQRRVRSRCRAACAPITLMHVRHGQARWEATVAPAERLARLGVPVSRALSRDLQAGAAALGADSEARRIFGKGTGTAVTEGDNFTQTDLAGDAGRPSASAAASISSRAPWRALMSDQIAQIGGSLPLEALRNAVPQAGPPAGESYGGFRVYVAPRADGRRAGAGRLERPAGAGRAACRPIRAASPASRRSTRRAARRPAACRWASCSARASIVPGTGILLGTPTADARRSARW